MDEHEVGYFDPLPEKPRSFAETQWSWIEAQLAASTADYVMLGGHYPVRTKAQQHCGGSV